MSRIGEPPRTRASARRTAALVVAMAVCLWIPVNGRLQTDRRTDARLDEALKREGNALVRLADAASQGRSIPADVALDWRNDFFKAHPGTFVPFTITFDARAFVSRHALMYIRAERRGGSPAASRAGRHHHAYETIFPLALPAGPDLAIVRRGFAVGPGTYRLVVVIREASADPLAPLKSRRSVAALVQDLEVPDFWTGELTTSTLMLADRLERLPGPVPPDELEEDPYVVGSHRIHPALGRSFRRNSELIVVFLVYNPAVGPDKQFDVQVDYHLYRRNRPGELPGAAGDHPPARAGERYVTRTNPQRFNPSLMGGQFDPAAGAPVLAGQGILLSAFEPGDYRLGITVTDLLSRKTVSRDVAFTVTGS